MNVFEEEARKKYLDLYYTEEGVKALETRLTFLANEYVKQHKYPILLNMLGFPVLRIHSKEHHEGMMENMRQILGLQEITVEVSKNDE